MCTTREFEVRVHKEFATRQILGFMYASASTDRGHGHSIEEGA